MASCDASFASLVTILKSNLQSSWSSWRFNSSNSGLYPSWAVISTSFLSVVDKYIVYKGDKVWELISVPTMKLKISRHNWNPNIATVSSSPQHHFFSTWHPDNKRLGQHHTKAHHHEIASWSFVHKLEQLQQEKSHSKQAIFWSRIQALMLEPILRKTGYCNG